jgi:hypothetical protein
MPIALVGFRSAAVEWLRDLNVSSNSVSSETRRVICA